jgi:hypothetical protein
MVHSSQRKESAFADRWPCFLVALTVLSLISPAAMAFVPTSPNSKSLVMRSPTSMHSDFGADDVSQTLARARALLAKSKAKLAAKEENERNAQILENDSGAQDGQSAALPFFASVEARTTCKRDAVIKSQDAAGLITTDGEKMASLSELEEWEFRGLVDVFDNESEENKEMYIRGTRRLADRDVAASIWNLRKKLHTKDFEKIFDPRNRFIGENN